MNNNSNNNNENQNNQNNRKNNNNNDTPPDLEKLWDDLQQQLNRLLGKKNRNQNNNGGDFWQNYRGNPHNNYNDNNNQNNQNNGDFNGWNNQNFNYNNNNNNNNNGENIFSRFNGNLFGIICVLAAIIWFASGFYIVDASQRGVVLRFGSFKESTEPGLRWRLPYPFESNEIVDLTGVRTIEVGYRGTEKNKVLKEALMLTDDENIVNIQFAVQYILKDPMEYLFYNRDTDEAVKGAAESAMREIVGKSKMDFVLYEGREQIATEVTKLIQDILDRYRSGVLISKVTLQNAQPPEQVQAAFDDAVKAGQDKERQKNEGQAYANDVVPKAKGTAARLMQEADAYKQSLIAAAEGNAERFTQLNNEYKKAPQVTKERLYLEMMENVLSKTSKIVVDSGKNGNGGNLLYLPLDKIISSTRNNENFLENSQNSQNSQSLQNFHNFQNSNEQISINQSSSQNPMLGSDVPQIETPPRVLRNGNNNLNLNLNLDRNRENR